MPLLRALGEYIPNISHDHAIPEIFIFNYDNHRFTLIHPQLFIMATSTPQYDATFLIWLPAGTPELGVVTAVQQSDNVSTGSFIVLRISRDPHAITFGAQMGCLLGFCGRFALIELYASGLPGVRYLMIVESWLQQDRFIWDRRYYEWIGGLPFDRILYRLTLRPLRWIQEDGEWRTTYEQEE